MWRTARRWTAPKHPGSMPPPIVPPIASHSRRQRLARPVSAVDATRPPFHRTKSMATLELAAAFTVWFLGFMVIGGEWFAMWQSARWNGQAAATRSLYCIGVTLLLLVHKE